MSNSIAWHYTTFTIFQQIRLSGELRPANEHIGRTEIPVNWFSTHPSFEPTALKLVRDKYTGQVRKVSSLVEQFVLGKGLIRIGAPTSKLLSGEALCQAAKIDDATWARLCKAGITAGASPSDWWGLPQAMSLNGLHVQGFMSEAGWQDCMTDTDIADYQQHYEAFMEETRRLQAQSREQLKARVGKRAKRSRKN